MKRKVLFSAVGNTDPVSRGYDGPLVHICRNYKPDVVYLFYSKDMIYRHERVEYCLSELEKTFDDGHRFEIIKMEEPTLEEAHKYNTFFELYPDYIKKILEKMEYDDELYLNVSSGTPQMGGALLLMAYMKEGNIIPLQVSNPDLKNNKSVDNSCPIEDEWKQNKNENLEINTNRVIEVECPDLIELLKKQLLQNFIEKYDYAAAIELAKNMKNLPEGGEKLLNGAIARMQLNLDKAQKKLIIKNEKIIDNPVGKKAQKIQLLVEYILEMGIKLEQKKNVDFIRSISPVLKDLYWLLLEQKMSINLKDYMDGKKLVRKKMEQTIEGRIMLGALDKKFNKYKDTQVAASNLVIILESCYSTQVKADKEVLYRIRFLRSVEYEVRNLAAHEIVSMPDDKMKNIFTEDKLRKCNINNYIKSKDVTFEKVYKDIQYLTEILCEKEVDWNSYAVMNERLIKELL